MESLEKKKVDLEKKFQKILQSPEGFGFFVAIHDFIECIESNRAFSSGLSHRTKINRELNIEVKYGFLLQIYQGLEDVSAKNTDDLGHERYATIRDLEKIRNREFSDHNHFWKKRQVFKKMAGEVYERLTANSR
ncbi:MAG TPA: hypothetical protein VNG29_00670 [Candidatus Paceibacterota bacterium]|nr:hypothetical protein [Candidatus Paceibacterota bacterium]